MELSQVSTFKMTFLWIPCSILVLLILILAGSDTKWIPTGAKQARLRRISKTSCMLKPLACNS